jgi:hypothetical protein
MLALIKEIEGYYENLKNSNDTIDRSNYGNKIIKILKAYPQVTIYWEYRPTKHFWVDRFCQVRVYEEEESFAPPVFYDIETNLRNAPSYSGLYFIGETHFNPFTEEKYYCVKIGLAKNIANRFKQYRTHTSMVYPLGFLESQEYVRLENYYHNKLNQVAIYCNQNNSEGWFVDKETFIDMYNKGFDYFD